MLPEESPDNVRTEDERDTSLIFAPTLSVFLRVRPQEIAQQARVWDVGWPVDFADLVETHQLRGQTAVHADDLVVDESCNWQTVEALSEHLPKLDIEPSLAFVIETIDSVDRSTLVVASKQEEVLWVLDFVGQEQADSLDVVFSTVNVVSQE